MEERREVSANRLFTFSACEAGCREKPGVERGSAKPQALLRRPQSRAWIRRTHFEQKIG
jgi:hypothetical protein